MPDSTIKIIVASHKKYWMPSDPIYVPVQVGASGKETIDGYKRDDDGINISYKNARYSELTALYWAWKNLDADYLGLAHYRRHFAGSGDRKTLTDTDARSLLREVNILVTQSRKYYIETLESHYSHTFDPRHLVILRSVLGKLSPESLKAFDSVMRHRSMHAFNMFVMRSDLADRYCSWLFPILAETEELIDFSTLSPFEARCIGRLSELLLDVWLCSNRLRFTEVPFTYLEAINYRKKAQSFLLAKFAGQKYKQSF